MVTRTFRVFVSSTFEDLREERDALQHEVFPKLAKLCGSADRNSTRSTFVGVCVKKRGSIRRRWKICLAEIERCQRTGIKPNFIVLLGDRYGWRPLPVRITADEFERVRDAINDGTDSALVQTWYQRDDNAIPPEYLLKPRMATLSKLVAGPRSSSACTGY